MFNTATNTDVLSKWQFLGAKKFAQDCNEEVTLEEEEGRNKKWQVVTES